VALERFTRERAAIGAVDAAPAARRANARHAAL
jgi:hypothetical protein